jgi:hypothetical protein
LICSTGAATFQSRSASAEQVIFLHYFYIRAGDAEALGDALGDGVGVGVALGDTASSGVAVGVCAGNAEALSVGVAISV